MPDDLKRGSMPELEPRTVYSQLVDYSVQKTFRFAWCEECAHNESPDTYQKGATAAFRTLEDALAHTRKDGHRLKVTWNVETYMRAQ